MGYAVNDCPSTWLKKGATVTVAMAVYCQPCGQHHDALGLKLEFVGHTMHYEDGRRVDRFKETSGAVCPHCQAPLAELIVYCPAMPDEVVH